MTLEEQQEKERKAAMDHLDALLEWQKQVDTLLEAQEHSIAKLQKNVDRINSIIVSIAYDPDKDIPRSEVLN